MANEHGFTAILTIHSNPSQEGSNKARGHLGSELLRRSETVFKLEHDRTIDQRTLTTSFSLGKNQSADVAETYFSWDDDKGMFTSIILDRRGKKCRKDFSATTGQRWCKNSIGVSATAPMYIEAVLALLHLHF